MNVIRYNSTPMVVLLCYMAQLARKIVRLHGSAHCTNLSPKKRSSEFFSCWWPKTGPEIRNTRKIHGTITEFEDGEGHESRNVVIS